jgi:hypothetical protein
MQNPRPLTSRYDAVTAGATTRTPERDDLDL